MIVLKLLFTLALANIKVATTTEDLSALVQSVGGPSVQVFSIGKGTQDPHQIEAKPSFMVKLRDVDVVFAQGLELESAWLTPLIQGARNEKLKKTNRVVELAGELDPIEIPKGEISRRDGDVHPGGNPHFQLDPIRMGRAAHLVAKFLSEIDPNQKKIFEMNADAFEKMMVDKTKDWKSRIAKTGVKKIVTYHKTLAYFCVRFELKCDLQLEPKPGIPPTTSHLLEVIDQMKKDSIGIVLIENLYPLSAGEKLKAELPKTQIISVPVSVGGAPGIATTDRLIESLVQSMEKGAAAWKP